MQLSEVWTDGMQPRLSDPMKTIHASASCIAAICLIVMAFEDIRQTDIAKETLLKTSAVHDWMHDHIEEQKAYRSKAEKFAEMYAKLKQEEQSQ